MRYAYAVLAIGLLAAPLFAQTEAAYDQDEAVESRSLLDPTRFSIHHSLSFGMASSSNSDLKSQSLYATMIQYKFAAPVTLNLNFGLPIHSTFNDARNLNYSNIESAEYFKNMPFDVHLTWKPRDDMALRLSVVKRDISDAYFGHLNSPTHYNILSDRWEW